jgi:hypothetical protein
LKHQGAKAPSFKRFYPQITQIKQIILNVTAFGGGKPRSEEILKSA